MKPLISLRDARADEGLLGTVLAGETGGPMVHRLACRDGRALNAGRGDHL
jgi:hypothetical protein